MPIVVELGRADSTGSEFDFANKCIYPKKNKDDSKGCQNKPSNIILFFKFNQNKGTLDIRKSKIALLVLNQSLISAVFQIVRFPGNQRIALIRESL